MFGATALDGDGSRMNLAAIAENTRRAAGSAAEAAAAQKAQPPRVQIKHIVAQADNESAQKLDCEAADAYYEGYRRVFGHDPVPEHECSLERLSGSRISWMKTPRRTSIAWSRGGRSKA